MSSLNRFAIFIFILALAAGSGWDCSRDGSPIAPADLDNGTGRRDGRSDPGFEETMSAANHPYYTSIADSVAGASGGTVSGTVSGYHNSFSIVIPEGAYSGTRNIEIKVPTAGVAVFRLLPEGSFNSDVSVTLDYYFWIQQGTIAQGDTCEVYYMNPLTGSFDSLDPPATFVADSTASTVTFNTNHFSNWNAHKRR